MPDRIFQERRHSERHVKLIKLKSKPVTRKPSSQQCLQRLQQLGPAPYPWTWNTAELGWDDRARHQASVPVGHRAPKPARGTALKGAHPVQASWTSHRPPPPAVPRALPSTRYRPGLRLPLTRHRAAWLVYNSPAASPPDSELLHPCSHLSTPHAPSRHHPPAPLPPLTVTSSRPLRLVFYYLLLFFFLLCAC